MLRASSLKLTRLCTLFLQGLHHKKLQYYCVCRQMISFQNAGVVPQGFPKLPEWGHELGKPSISYGLAIGNVWQINFRNKGCIARGHSHEWPYQA